MYCAPHDPQGQAGLPVPLCVPRVGMGLGSQQESVSPMCVKLAPSLFLVVPAQIQPPQNAAEPTVRGPGVRPGQVLARSFGSHRISLGTQALCAPRIPVRAATTQRVSDPCQRAAGHGTQGEGRNGAVPPRPPLRAEHASDAGAHLHCRFAPRALWCVKCPLRTGHPRGRGAALALGLQ